MKEDEAKYLVNYNEGLGKRSFNWEAPVELARRTSNNYKTIIGIGRWNGGGNRPFVALSRRGELIYVDKKVWLEIAEYLKKIPTRPRRNEKS